jgi:hypothetical protein
MLICGNSSIEGLQTNILLSPGYTPGDSFKGYPGHGKNTIGESLIFPLEIPEMKQA